MSPMKKKVLIVGCGFAGFSASRQLLRFRREVDVTVIDKKDTFDFLPLLPDTIGRGITPAFLASPIRPLSEKLGFNFINAEVYSIDTENNTVRAKEGTLNYDYLIVASGSETNFYGRDEIKRHAFKLNDVNDAVSIIAALEKKDFSSFIISGGGYTGIETATNLKVYLRKRGINKKIIIVERAPSILAALPQCVGACVSDNLKRLGIDCLTNTVVDEAQEEGVRLSSQEVIPNSMLIWAAGVRSADFIQGIIAEKSVQGRIKVDEYLRLKGGCFAAGDAAYFSYRGAPLRMAVQFAINEGVLAASNIIRSIRKRPLIKFRPFDLGYIIPMANNRSCGRVLGLNVKGLFATALHFSMCIYRSLGLKNKSGVIKDLIRGG